MQLLFQGINMEQHVDVYNLSEVRELFNRGHLLGKKLKEIPKTRSYWNFKSWIRNNWEVFVEYNYLISNSLDKHAPTLGSVTTDECATGELYHIFTDWEAKLPPSHEFIEIDVVHDKLYVLSTDKR